jgi:hypothetical protein
LLVGSSSLYSLSMQHHNGVVAAAKVLSLSS